MALVNCPRGPNDTDTSIDFKTINRAVSTPGSTSFQNTGLGQGSSSLSDQKVQKIIRWQVTNTNIAGAPITYYAAIVNPAGSSTEQPTDAERFIQISVNACETVILAKEEQPVYLYVGDLKDLALSPGLHATYSYQEWTEV